MATFSDNLANVPHNPFDSSNPYRYDNDGATTSTCGWAPGVNIILYGFDTTFAPNIDSYIDKTLSPSCGKFRYNASSVSIDGGYHISNGSDF